MIFRKISSDLYNVSTRAVSEINTSNLDILTTFPMNVIN